MSKKILVIQGPNLNMVGHREPDIYGMESIEDINCAIVESCANRSFVCDIVMSNSEGEIIDAIHSSNNIYDGIIINAGAYTHYSLAIMDAIKSVTTPCIEVHMSNIFAREKFRHKSVISSVCIGTICGFGKTSYLLAIEALSQIL